MTNEKPIRTADISFINTAKAGVETFEADGVPRCLTASWGTELLVYRELPYERLDEEARGILDEDYRFIATELIHREFVGDIRAIFGDDETEEEHAEGRKIVLEETARELERHGVPAALCADIAEDILERAGC